MPDYIAFLRAINLGATRKFAKADIVTATEDGAGHRFNNTPHEMALVD